MTSALGWVKGPVGVMLQSHPVWRRDMLEEDEGPARKRSRLEKLVLDALGIEELRDYIVELRDEIARVEADIDRKQGHRSAADTFFRRP
jgi:uncharacterized small protein (DUF1192 family)